MKKFYFAIALTAVLWFIMFSPWTAPHLNFWVAMSISALTLWVISFSFDKNLRTRFSFNLKDILIGIGSAALLWGIFYVGNFLSSLMFDFAPTQVGSIYDMKSGNNLLYLTLGLLLLIGPAEEIFWRGYVQQTLGEKYGRWTAIVVASLVYALVHIWSFNFMLIMAALVCGLFWGILYAYNKNLVTVIISHAIWDAAVFIWFPIVS